MNLSRGWGCQSACARPKSSKSHCDCNNQNAGSHSRTHKYCPTNMLASRRSRPASTSAGGLVGYPLGCALPSRGVRWKVSDTPEPTQCDLRTPRSREGYLNLAQAPPPPRTCHSAASRCSAAASAQPMTLMRAARALVPGGWAGERGQGPGGLWDSIAGRDSVRAECTLVGAKMPTLRWKSSPKMFYY